MEDFASQLEEMQTKQREKVKHLALVLPPKLSLSLFLLRGACCGWFSPPSLGWLFLRTHIAPSLCFSLETALRLKPKSETRGGFALRRRKTKKRATRSARSARQRSRRARKRPRISARARRAAAKPAPCARSRPRAQCFNRAKAVDIDLLFACPTTLVQIFFWS